MCTLCFNNKHYSTPRSAVGGLQGWEIADTEEPHVQRAAVSYMQIFAVQTVGVPTPMLFKGQLNTV